MLIVLGNFLLGYKCAWPLQQIKNIHQEIQLHTQSGRIWPMGEDFSSNLVTATPNSTVRRIPCSSIGWLELPALVPRAP